MNPIDLEKLVLSYIEKIKPDVVVTYAIHGISGHHDHLTIHAVVKRLYCELRSKPEYSYWKRLALFTFPTPENSEQDGAMAHVRTSKQELIDCIITLDQLEKDKLKEALFCYKTFMDVIESTNVINVIGDKVYFEFYGENFTSPLNEITGQLKSY